MSLVAIAGAGPGLGDLFAHPFMRNALLGGKTRGLYPSRLMLSSS